MKYHYKLTNISPLDIEEGVIEKFEDEGWEIMNINHPNGQIWCGEKSIPVMMRKKRNKKH